MSASEAHIEAAETYQLTAEVVTPDMIAEAVAESLTAHDAETLRALELPTEEEVAAVADTNEDAESGVTPEVETAEEVSLKNGVYQEIKRKLHERFGIPLDEIAFAHDADTVVRKAALYKAVNQGTVRVLIGSTGKLGTGVNVQKRLIALHHVDQPWKPAEREQREGRILRQGNIYPEVFVFDYVTERSFDAYMLQTLESKARFINQIMAGEVTARTAEDVGDMVLTVAQVKAIASGNPLVQQRIELEVKLVKLDRLRAAYYNNRAQMRDELETLPHDIEVQQAELRGHRRALRVRQPLAEDKFVMQLRQNLAGNEGHESADEDRTADVVFFDKRERAGAHLRFLAELTMDRLRRRPSQRSITEEVGTYRGFRMSVTVSGNSRLAHHSSLFNYQAEIHLHAILEKEADAESGDAPTCYIAQIGDSNVGITQSVDWQLRHLEDRVEQTEGMIRNLEARLEMVQREVEQPWAHAREYRRLRRVYEETGTQLQADGVPLESNTCFAAEDDADVGSCEEEVTATAEAVATSDETATRRNPYTGLEEWVLIASESPSEAEIEGTSGIDVGGHELSLFDFTVSGETGCNNGEDDECDIFLATADGEGEVTQVSASPRTNAEASGDEVTDAEVPETSFAVTAEVDVNDIFGDATDSGVITTASTSAVRNGKRAKSKKKIESLKAKEQGSFLFC